MKICKSILTLALLSVLICFVSCSDAEEVYYYSFKEIEYTVGPDDGMTDYETPWVECYIVVNGNETAPIKSGPGDLYIGYHEHYYFECADASLFNPTPGYVHVPLPEALSSGGQVIFDEKEGEYSLEKVETNRSYEGKMFDIPAKTKLVVERKVATKKLMLTYKATFQRHPSGSDHIVTGKFIRHIPVGIALMESYEPVTE